MRATTHNINTRFPYQEEPESIADTLHEQLILPEVFLIDIKHLRVVEPAHNEKADEKPYDHVDTGQC